MLPLTELFLQYETELTALQLVLAMLGMGATLTPAEFYGILRRPTSVALVLALQFLIMPAAALALAWLVRLPEEIAIGLLLVMVLPSGAQSNIFTYLGRGNVPLSITATCASTALCLLVTPLVLSIFGSLTMPGDFRMPTDRVVRCILFELLAPLLGGMLVAHYWPKGKKQFSRIVVRISLVVLAVVVVGALASGRLDASSYGWWPPVWVVLFVVGTSMATKLFTKILGYDAGERFTIAVEVTMRNAPLGLALAGPLFREAGARASHLTGGSMYVCLLAAGAMLGSAGVAVARNLRRYRK